jgi:hypothetical protein
MKNIWLLASAAVIGLTSAAVLADEASSPIPIHRTHARHRSIRQPKTTKPAAQPVIKPAASSAQ